MVVTQVASPVLDQTVYSKRKNYSPFYVPTLDDYALVVGEEKIKKLEKLGRELKGLRLLKINATAQGGGVAEMLYSSVPFLNMLGIEAEWKILKGEKEYFECTKSLHNMLQGMSGSFNRDMEQVYFCTLEGCINDGLIDYNPDVVVIHDPQPLGLRRFHKMNGQTWLWRCHIDIEEAAIDNNPSLWKFMSKWAQQYDASIFSAAHYVVSFWPIPKFIIPPFIDPLSEKNRELSDKEIDSVLGKYHIDPSIPIIAQIGRFDPWKGLDRTIETFRLVRKEKTCQLIMAGGYASDDPEAERIVSRILEETKNDEDIHVLNLDMTDRLANYREVNALQRAADIIMQPSTKEGFGLVITEALWKAKPVISSNVGAIPLQIRDGDTGYFYNTAQKTAQKIIHFLENPEAAKLLGSRGKDYVKEHFLMPDRIMDYMMTIHMSTYKLANKKLPDDCIISFHPWFKLSKRG